MPNPGVAVDRTVGNVDRIDIEDIFLQIGLVGMDSDDDRDRRAA